MSIPRFRGCECTGQCGGAAGTTVCGNTGEDVEPLKTSRPGRVPVWIYPGFRNVGDLFMCEACADEVEGPK